MAEGRTGPLVLVAEDDPAVRTLMARILEAEGYTVRTASDGRQALALLECLPNPADVLVTDLRMPGLTGDKLALSAQESGLVRRVLFVTGFDVLSEAVRLAGPILFKPFDPADLSTAVRQLLRAA